MSMGSVSGSTGVLLDQVHGLRDVLGERAGVYSDRGLFQLGVLSRSS